MLFLTHYFDVLVALNEVFCITLVQIHAVLEERSFGEPMCLCKYAIRNKTGNQKKNLYGIKQYLRELESQRRWRSMLP